MVSMAKKEAERVQLQVKEQAMVIETMGRKCFKKKATESNAAERFSNMRTENVPGFHNMQDIGEPSGIMGHKPDWNVLRVSVRRGNVKEKSTILGIAFGNM